VQNTKYGYEGIGREASVTARGGDEDGPWENDDGKEDEITRDHDGLLGKAWVAPTRSRDIELSEPSIDQPVWLVARAVEIVSFAK
jgi:hypothetical protein